VPRRRSDSSIAAVAALRPAPPALGSRGSIEPPNFVAITSRSRRPGRAARYWPRTSSARPWLYLSAVSRLLPPAAIDESLRRLGTDYVDLYWPHNWDPHTPLEETISTLDDLVRAGKVRYVGLSDFPAWAIARAETLAELRGLRSRVAAIQLEYSLLERTVEGEQLGVAEELGLGVMPWSPLASGVLSGKYSRGGPPPQDSGRGQFAAPHLNSRTYDLLEAMGAVAAELGASVAAVALAWVRQQPRVTSTLVGARTVEQLDKNLASLDVTLEPEHLGTLDRMTTPQLGFPLEFLRSVGPGFLQGDTTIDGVTATALSVS
jgi:aryl-alcohol dehydrogenase-like predicted oxidoreductase